MLCSEFFQQLPVNATILTPNSRLSAYLAREYAKRQAEQKPVWQSLDILPLSAWISRTWHELEDFTPDMLKTAAREFAIRAALGTDSFHPRSFRWLSDSTLALMSVFSKTAGTLGKLPAALNHLIIPLLAKAPGGMRPIGLFTGLVR